MKGLAFVAVVAPAFVEAQTGWWLAFSRSIKAIPVAQLKSGPQTKPPAGAKQFKFLHAEKARWIGDQLEASGDVHVLYDDYEIFADRLTGNRITQTYRLEGNGRLIGQTETITGDVVMADFKTKQFSFENGHTRLKPEAMQGQAKKDLFTSAKAGAGTGQDFSTEKGQSTFCDLDHPHFELRYDTNRVLPGKRIELRGVSLVVLDKTLFKVPMLVLPLDQRKPKDMPEVGQSIDEGYYLKTKYTLPMRGDSYVQSHLDLMSKLGTGLGLDYNYSGSKVKGVISAYTVSGGSRSKVVTATHQQKFGRGTFSLTNRYQQSDYLTAPSSTMWSTNAMLQLPWGTGASRLGFTRFSSQTSGFNSSSENLTFSDDHMVSKVQSRMSLSYSRSDTSSIFSDPTKSERIDVRYNAATTTRSFNADLQYQRAIPIGATANFYGSNDITPMFTLRSTADQLFGKKVSNFLPFNAEASIGELTNGGTTNSSRVTRTKFDLGFRRGEGHGTRWTLDWGSRFIQGLYSDDTAQYAINYDGTLAYNFRNNSSISLSYQNLRAVGYTPLAIDSTGRSDAFNFNLNYKPSKALTLTAQTGYDILQSTYGQTPWQFVYLRSRYNPGKSLDLTTTLSYDTYNSVWSNFRLDSLMNVGPTKVSFGTRYDGLRAQFSGFNLLVEGFKAGKFTTNFLVDYNGYDKKVDAQHYQVIYDLHCAEAVFEVIDNAVGFRSGRTFNFYIRLKALPQGSNFGYGTRGQSIGGGGYGGGGFGG